MLKVLIPVLVAAVVLIGIVVTVVLLNKKKRSAAIENANVEKQSAQASAKTDPVADEEVATAKSDVVTDGEVATAKSDIVADEEREESSTAITNLVTDEAQAAAASADESTQSIAQEQSAAEEESVENTQVESEQEQEIEEPEEEDEPDVEEEEEYGELKMIVEDGETRYIVIKYKKSFKAKLIQNDEKNKAYYSELKNWLLSFDRVKSRISWKWEAFHVGRKTVAKLRIRRKTLSIVLALDPAQFAESKYRVEDLGEMASYVDTPCLYHVKNDRQLKYAKELISLLMQNEGAQQKMILDEDYASQFPYETTDALIEQKLIKVLTNEAASKGEHFKPRHSVSAYEVDSILQDEVAVAMIERDDGITDKSKTAIINIDTLSQYFNDGETVTLDEIKTRVKGFSQKVTYIKVLARGVLDKAITVEANDFSLQAVKMIILTGGKAVKV